MLRCIHGKKNYVYSVTKSIHVGQEVTLVFLGWRKKFLFPYVRDLISYETTGNKTFVEKRSGLKWTLRMFWLGTIMGFVDMAIENNMDVVCSEQSDGEASIKFLVQ